jgi:glucose/arabinose dehydrogenase
MTRRLMASLGAMATLSPATGVTQASPDRDSARITITETTDMQAVTVARGLESPWSLGFTPDGRILVTERPGRVRIISGDSLDPSPWAEITVVESAAGGFETGLMGLAIDPGFATTRRVYVCYTHGEGGSIRSNRIGVLTERNGRGEGLRVLLDDIPANRYHNGCRLAFGPDGKLYATTGDAGTTRAEGAAAQSSSSLAGKVLRLDPDGSIPADNPDPRSYVWTVGHRNAQGLAFDPVSGRLWSTGHGTGGSGNNELNLIERGGNYGWPLAIGEERDRRFAAPIVVWPHAPAGMTFVRGDRYPSLRGTLLVATLSAQRLLCVSWPDGDSATPRTETLLESTYGRLRDVAQSPDGWIYLATSNRDGRGVPVRDDDRILRLVGPAPVR